MTDLTPNPMPEGQSCGTCRFAGTHVQAGHGAERTLVRCLRYPPQRLGQAPEFNSAGPIARAREDTGWPVLTWDDWCGEWQQRLPTAEEAKELVTRFLEDHREGRSILEPGR